MPPPAPHTGARGPLYPTPRTYTVRVRGNTRLYTCTTSSSHPVASQCSVHRLFMQSLSQHEICVGLCRVEYRHRMSNALHSTENVARMRACSALVHSTRARAAPSLSPRPRHTSAAMPGCAQTAACRALAANGDASSLLSACSSISAHAICTEYSVHLMHRCMSSPTSCAYACVRYLRALVPRTRPVQHESHRPPGIVMRERGWDWGYRTELRPESGQWQS